MSQLQKLTVKGYKSIQSLEDFELRPLNVLIGANGAGKSNFIGLFRFLHEMYEQQLQLYVQKQGGIDAFLYFGRGRTPELEVEFQFAMPDQPGVGLGYRFGLIPSVDNRFLFEFEETSFQLGGAGLTVVNPRLSLGQGHAESKLKEAKDDYSRLARPEVSNWRVYHFHDTSDTATVKRIHPVNDNLRLKPDAANLAPYLRMLHQRYPQEYQRIVETIRLVLPFFDDFVHRDNVEHVQVEWKQVGHPDTPFKAHMLSDGSLRFICLTTLLLQPVALLPDTILIDEPELGLHPYAVDVLADLFKQVAEDKQLIVSTQSVELINALSPEDVVVVDQVQGASTFQRLDQNGLADWLKDYALGELWKRNILGGRP